MPVTPGPDCVGEELSRFKKGEMHSGKGGKVVTDPRQARAIALSACGESRYSEQLQSMGFPASTADEVVAMFAEGFLKKAKSSASSASFEEPDWKRQFETGKSPSKENPENYETGIPKNKGRGQLPISRTGVKGDLGKQKVNDDSEMLSPVSFPKQRADWGNPPSRQLNGLQMLG
jgi:hypothetical protein